MTKTIVGEALRFIRGIVRPALALGFSAAQIALGFVWADGYMSGTIPAEQMAAFAPFAGLMPVTLIVVRDYFASRPNRSETD